MIFLLLIAISILGGAFYAACHEKEVSWRYSGIFGYFKASFVTGGLLGGSFLFVGEIIAALNGMDINELGKINAIIGILMVYAAVSLFKSVKKNCPDGKLRDRLLLNMFIVSAGKGFKFIFFFLSFLFDAFGPKKFIDEDGRELYIFIDGDVYDPQCGEIVGKKISDTRYERYKK